MKTTYGRVSRYGLIAMASSLDQIGPITKTVEDAEIMAHALAGVDVYDATTIQLSNKKTESKKIGVMAKLLEIEGLDKDVKQNFNEAIEKFKSLGYEIVPIDLPHIDYSLPIYYIICPAEVSSNMARFDGMRFGKKISGDNLLADYMETRGTLLGKEVKRRIMIGTYVLSSGYYDSYYGKAGIVRELIKRDFEKV